MLEYVLNPYLGVKVINQARTTIPSLNTEKYCLKRKIRNKQFAEFSERDSRAPLESCLNINT